MFSSKVWLNLKAKKLPYRAFKPSIYRNQPVVIIFTTHPINFGYKTSILFIKSGNSVSKPRDA